MNHFFRIALILSLLFTSQSVLAVDGKPVVPDNDTIHLQLETDAPKNPVKNNEEVDLEAIEDELPENNAEMLKPAKKTPYYPNNEAESNAESEFSIFDDLNIDEIFDKNRDNVIDEDTLLGKIYHKKITRTDVPTYLLKEELTFRPKKGPVSKMQFFGAFQERLFSDWQNADNDFGYDNGFEEIGIIGKFRNTNTDFKIMVKPRPNDKLNYMQSFIGDAYIINSSIPNHKIVVGYQRNQIGKEGGSSSYILPFVTRS